MHSAFNLFVFPNSMFTPLLLLFFLYERAMSSPEKRQLKITIIIIIITTVKNIQRQTNLALKHPELNRSSRNCVRVTVYKRQEMKS